MSKLTKNENQGRTDKFERFVALNSGEFWQAKRSDESRYVDEGEILLISKIDYVDNAPHTIHVRLHPSKVKNYGTEMRFLAEEFISNFEFVEQHIADASRKAEMEAIQGRIQKEQDEMQQAFSNPDLLEKLVDGEIPKKEATGEAKLPAKLETFGADIVGAVKTQNITALMSKGLTETGIEQIRSGLEGQKEIAERRSQWIQMRTKRLTQISAEITPYFEEKAAFPLAMTREMMSHVDELMKGIGNLNLYVLKDVTIETVKEGQSAPPKEKLSVTQRVLYMDEEMGVWADLSEDFDYDDVDNFQHTLKNSEGLVNQIFPTARCVVSIAATRKHHEYKGYSAYERDMMHKENRRQFLLVRDGENIYMVLSPELFHNYSRTTFPTKDETESVFTGMDGSTISYRDLDYTRRLQEHERIALGYKRLLILLCGLDHNKQLFGEFYDGEPSLQFVSLGFQQRYFNFIHDVDGEGMLPSYRPANVLDWADKMNSEISFGSRVLVKWHNVITEDNCPSVFEKESRYNRGYDNRRGIQYSPTEGRVIYGVISKRGGDMIMKVEVSGRRTSDYEKRTFEAVLNVSDALRHADTFDILCVDRLNPKDALWYLHDRPSRNIHFNNIMMLKRALGYAEELRKEESGLRTELTKAINDSGMFDDLEELERIIDHAIAKWRCANPRKDVQDLVGNKKEFNLLCDQIYMLAGKGRDPEQEIMESEQEIGRKVLRIALQPNGKYVAYSTPLDSERDDRVYPFTWVARTSYNILKKGVRASKATFVHLGKVNNAETVMYESDDIEQYVVPKDAPFDTVKKKEKFLNSIKESNDQLREVLRIKAESDRDAVLAMIEAYDECRDKLTYGGKSKGVVEPYMDLAIGASAEFGAPAFVGIKAQVIKILAWIVEGDKELEHDLRLIHENIYERKDKANERFDSILSSCKGKSLFKVMGVQTGRSVYIDMHYAPNDYYGNISEVDGYNYSLAKRVAKLEDKSVSVWLVDSTMDTLDEDYDMTRPDDYDPLIVVSSSFFSDEKATHVFKFTDENMQVLKRVSSKVVDNLEALEDAYQYQEYYHTDGSSIRFKVKQEWSDVPAGEVNGIKAERSFVYKEIA